MTIQALGYLGIGTDRLDDWADYATHWLGMQRVDRGAGVCAFRMDDRRQRLVIDRSLPEGQRYFGWEVADAAALDALAARLEAGGVAVTREPASSDAWLSCTMRHSNLRERDASTHSPRSSSSRNAPA